MEKFDVDDFTFDSLLGVLQKGLAMQNDIEEYLRPFNISHGRFSILLTLSATMDESVCPSHLAEVLNKKRPTITGMMKKLVKDSMVIEVSDGKDARRKLVKLGQAGYDLLERIVPDYNNRIKFIGSGLTHDEKLELKRLVGKIKI